MFAYTGHQNEFYTFYEADFTCFGGIYSELRDRNVNVAMSNFETEGWG